MLAGGRVRVNGMIARRADTALAAGDVVEIAARGPRAALPPGLVLVYEDGDVIVVEKPAGLLTIATERERERTVYAHLMARARTRKPPARVFVVHRLDRLASGLLVFATSPGAKRALQAQFAAHTVERTYLAVVEGRPARPEGTIASRLLDDAPGRVRETRRPGQGRAAVTRWRVLRTGAASITPAPAPACASSPRRRPRSRGWRGEGRRSALASVALLRDAHRRGTCIGGAFRDGLVHQGQHLAREPDREAPQFGIGRTGNLTCGRGPLRMHALLEEERQQPDERLDAESNHVAVALQGPRCERFPGHLLQHVNVQARVRVRTHGDPGRAGGLLDDAPPRGILLEDPQDGLAVGLRQHAERPEDPLEERIRREIGEQPARGGEQGLQRIEPTRAASVCRHDGRAWSLRPTAVKQTRGQPSQRSGSSTVISAPRRT